MASVNKVIVLGNLGADPELRYTQSNMAVATLSVATTEKWKDKEGNGQESTEWHRIVVWNKQAENCAKYLAKGRSVYVEGKLQTRSWDDKQTGQKRYATEIVAQMVQFLGGNPNNQQGQGQQQQRQENAQKVDQQMQGNPYPQNSGQPPMGPGGQPPGMDEIPF